MNYLGLDYGAAKIGVALSGGSLAQPLETLSTASSIKAIEALIKKHRIVAIIIGTAPKAYIVQLRSLRLPVFVVDETLSSHDARRALFHTSQTKRRELEHTAAAAIILQNWLDSHLPA